MKLKRTVSVSMILLLIGTLGLCSKIDPARSESRTWTVDDDGPADFHTIQQALDAASDGDTIQVSSGTYREAIAVDKAVSLVGENRDTTVVDGNGAQSAAALNHNASITGFTIRNGGYGIGILWIDRSNCSIRGNRIVGNSYGGVYLYYSGNITLSDNLIEDNALFGVFLCAASNNTINNNTILNNGHGLAFSEGSHGNILRNNKMTRNRYNFGIIIPRSANYIFSKPDMLANDVDASNTVDGKPVCCWVDRHNEQVPQDAGYVWLASCTNITVRGLSLSNNLQGILLMRSNNTIVADNTIANNVYGIYTVAYSSNNTIVNNTVRDNAVFGIHLSALSMFTIMRNNNISGSQMNFGLFQDAGKYGLSFTYPLDLLNDIDMSNTVDGKPIVYWINQHNRHVPKDAGYVALVNCSDIIVEDLNLTNNVQNILVLATNNTVVTNNSIANSVYGIDVRYVSFLLGDLSNVTGINDFDSFNTTISGNILVDNVVGILLRSNQSKILENTLYRDVLGICLPETCNSMISKNVLCACTGLMSGRLPGNLPYQLQFFYYPEDPIYYSREAYNIEWGGIVIGGSFNVVCNNTVMNSGIDGILVYDRVRALGGSNNTIFHNNFISNYPFQAEESPRGINLWDNGYPSGGNYWSDYVGFDVYSGADQNEPGSDGIGDTPCLVPNMKPSWNASEDRYPLMNPIPWASKLDSFIKVGVNSDDWIKYDYVIFGSHPGTSLPDWMKAKFLTVEGTAANVNVTMHMSNGTEQSQTMAMDFVAGNGTLGTFSGFVIPAGSTTGDFAYLSGIGGNVMILDETTRIYGGARRTAVRASFLSNGIQFNYYWDKQTGVLVEASAVSDHVNGSARASETNMWQSQANLTDVNNDGVVNIVDIGIVARSFGTREGHLRYNPIADFDENGEINIVDISKVGKDFGRQWKGV